MIEVWQAEWCPHSHRVRQRLTELGVPFVARQVEAEPADRAALREATGQDEIPAVVLEDARVLSGPDEAILARLDERYDEPPEAAAHRRMAAEH
jgi:glutaredoxin